MFWGDKNNMLILDLTIQKIYDKFNESFYNKDNFYLILSKPNELDSFKGLLNIDEITFKDCLIFDENIRLDLFDNYDFLTLNTFELKDNKSIIKEVNIYISDNYILVVVDENHYIHDYINKLISGCYTDSNPRVALYKINYLIFKEIIINGFENIEKLEDMILDIEDSMLEGAKEKHLNQISYVRGLTRTVVKNTRPLLYIGDRILKENTRYLKSSDIKKYNLENLQSIDFGIDKLYNFALSTRELADKLLDIYSSQVAEKTNALITKLTVLTGIAAPLTIITGIYGMNFRIMPELNFIYGYPITIFIMILIVVVSIIMFKIKKLL